MHRTPAWRRYLRFWGPDVDADIADELRFHLDALVSELVTAGLTPAAARAEARRRFGNVDHYRSALEEASERDARAARFSTFVETLRQDASYGARTLMRAPVFTAVAVASLALGIGANSAIFSLVDAILLRPLPAIHEPARLAEVSSNTFSYPDYRDFRDGSRSWSGLAAYREREVSLGAAGTASLARVAIVSGNYFSVLGTAAVRGRTILPDDDDPGVARQVAVISYGLWQREFGGDAGIVGQTVQLNGAPFTILGVAPPGFRGPRIVGVPTVWIPINVSPSIATGEIARLNIERRGWGWLTMVGRLAPGVTVGSADAEMDLVAERLRQVHDASSQGPATVELRPAAQTILGSRSHGAVVGFMSVLAAVVAIALLVACANVANLQLARSAARSKEVTVRLALGAGRARLVRQLVTESVVLALLGGLAALVVSRLMIGLLAAFSLPGGVSVTDVTGDLLSGRLLAFTFAVAFVTGVAFGLVPALRASKPELVAALKDSQRFPTSHAGLRLRGVLVAAQIALCLVLLAGAGLFVRSLQQAVRVDLGFRPENVAVATFHLGLMRYDSIRARAFYDRVTERVRRTPGVRAVAWAGALPFGDVDVMTVRRTGSREPFEKVPRARFVYVDGDYSRLWTFESCADVRSTRAIGWAHRGRR